MQIRNCSLAQLLEEDGNEDQEELKICTGFQVQKGWRCKNTCASTFGILLFLKGESLSNCLQNNLIIK